MKDITRYTYLNLETRPDRRLLAECTAHRDGIPRDLVHFWTGEAYFQTWDEIGRHAVKEHGFESFKQCIGNDKSIINTAIRHMYNNLRYLTDRMERKDTLEVFLHDDVCLRQAYTSLNALCRTLQQHGELNILLLDPFYLPKTIPEHFKERSFFRPNGVDIGDLVYEGIRSACDFAMVFSAKGAEYLRDIILNSPPWRTIETIWSLKDWDLPGTFTTVSPYVSRYPTSLVGSDGFPSELPIKK